MESENSESSVATPQSSNPNSILGKNLFFWGMIHSKKDNADKTEVSVPTLIAPSINSSNPAIGNCIAVQCQNFGYAAITEDGRLYTFGRNEHGNLGQQGEYIPHPTITRYFQVLATNSTTNFQKIDVLSNNSSNPKIVKMSVGFNATLLLDSQNRAYFMGKFFKGAKFSMPFQLQFQLSDKDIISEFSEVCAGGENMLFLLDKTRTKLFAISPLLSQNVGIQASVNSPGDAGGKSTISFYCYSIQDLFGANNSNCLIKQMSCGPNYVVFLTENDKIFHFGFNSLFNDYKGPKGKTAKALAEIETPQLLKEEGEFIEFLDVSKGRWKHHFGIVTNLGRVFMIGSNYKYKLGFKTEEFEHEKEDPIAKKIRKFAKSAKQNAHDDNFYDFFIEVPFFRKNNIKIRKLACGGLHTMFLTQNNELYAVGCGSNGRLGFVESEHYVYLYKEKNPRKIETISNVVDISTSYYQDICLTK